MYISILISWEIVRSVRPVVNVNRITSTMDDDTIRKGKELKTNIHVSAALLLHWHCLLILRFPQEANKTVINLSEYLYCSSGSVADLFFFFFFSFFICCNLPSAVYHSYIMYSL